MRKESKILILRIISAVIGFCFIPITIFQTFPNELYLIGDTFVFSLLFAFLFFNLIEEDIK